MTRKIQSKFAVFAALAALAAVLVPAGLASGTHTEGTDGDFVGSSGVLRLHMASDGDRFTWTGSGTPQVINQTRCEVTPKVGSLVSFDNSSNRGAGIKDHGLGVKSGGSQGTACSRVSGTESLKLSLVGPDIGHLSVSEAQLDVEVKGGAEIVLTTFFDGVATGDAFMLRSGSSIVNGEGDDPDETPALTMSTSVQPIANCRNRADSGPDAGANDNCRWVVQDMIPFDSMIFTVNSGEFTLEGGNDGTPPAPGSEAYGGDSLFFLSEIDGLLTCGDSEDIGDSTSNSVYGTLAMHAMNVDIDLPDWNVTGCLLKPFTSSINDDPQDPSLNFVPDLEGTQARYTIVITVEGQDLTTDGTGTINSLKAVYDPDLSDTDPPQPMFACLGAPVLADDPTTVGVDEYEEFWTQSGVDGVGLLPDDESACFYSASVSSTGDGIGTEVWGIYFEDDPGFSFK